MSHPAPYPPDAEYHPKPARDIIEAIRTHRNGEEQATGELATLQARLGDSDLTRIMLQMGYALGYCHSALGRPAQIKPGALAWTAVAELFGHQPLGLNVLAEPEPPARPADG